MASKTHVQTTINGESIDFLCEPRQSLLECLRDVIGLTGSKEGCNDGNCGACTVVFDGKIVTSCLVLGVEAEGKEITTIEGIASGSELHPVQQAFLEKRRSPMWHLHSWIHRCYKSPTGTQPRPHRTSDTFLAGKQPLSLYRL